MEDTNNVYSQQAFSDWHNLQNISRCAVNAAYPRGLFVDIHGQAHAEAWFELGYQASSSQLRTTPDGALLGLANSTSLRALAGRKPGQFADFVRGVNSIGGLMQAYGWVSVPSPAYPFPNATNSYFDGGYNTGLYGSKLGGTIDGLQIETPSYSRLSGDATMRAVARDIARSLHRFLVVAQDLNTTAVGVPGGWTCPSGGVATGTKTRTLTRRTKTRTAPPVLYTCGQTVPNGVTHAALAVVSSGNYAPSTSCSWTFNNSNAGCGVSVTLNSINTEAWDANNRNGDVVSVRNGQATTGQTIWTWTGSSLPAVKTVRSTGQYLTVNFVADSDANVGTGFSATVSAYCPVPSPRSTFYAGDSVPVGRVDTTDVVLKVVEGGNYLNSKNGTWTVQSAAATACLEILFSAFDTEAGVDTVAVYDGATAAAAVLLGPWSGASLPTPPSYRSSGSSLTVQFLNNASVSRAGFAATVYNIECPATPTPQTGTRTRTRTKRTRTRTDTRTRTRARTQTRTRTDTRTRTRARTQTRTRTDTRTRTRARTQTRTRTYTRTRTRARTRTRTRTRARTRTRTRTRTRANHTRTRTRTQTHTRTRIRTHTHTRPTPLDSASPATHTQSRIATATRTASSVPGGGSGSGSGSSSAVVGGAVGGVAGAALLLGAAAVALRRRRQRPGEGAEMGAM
eukprot:TRINITY_DN158_c1_g2_i5.p1 TRINITY_DN158_c1_g2~~TRINITY_DN158_c1_g2_i5.p1  ORF type:complete len:680 (-),score=110.58 TRINITY_DN158_c1_g2_i5:7-2046(-)